MLDQVIPHRGLELLRVPGGSQEGCCVLEEGGGWTLTNRVESIFALTGLQQWPCFKFCVFSLACFGVSGVGIKFRIFLMVRGTQERVSNLASCFLCSSV